MLKIKCPKCGADACQIGYGRLTGTSIGILIGITSTLLSCIQSAKAPSGLINLANKALRTITENILAMLANVSTGGFIGQQAGDLIDENLIRTYRCLKCKHRFRI